MNNEQDDLDQAAWAHQQELENRRREEDELLVADPEYADWIDSYDNTTRQMREQRMKPKTKHSGGKDFEPVPAGNHIAILNKVIDFGLQPGSDRYPEPKYQIYLGFEIPGTTISYERDGETVEGPMAIGNTYTNSMHPKANLRKFIESMYGKPFPSDEIADEFDYTKMLGTKCMLNIAHRESGGKTYANIIGAAPLPRGMVDDSQAKNPLLAFDCDSPDPDVYDQLPRWMREKKIDERIQDEDNYSQTRPQAKSAKEQAVAMADGRASTPTPAADSSFDDDIPF
jgi:hypothetical protein